MITFKLKFLLAFSPKTKEKPKKEKIAKEKPGGKKKQDHEAQVDPPYVIRLDKSFSVAHLEYELIPGKCKYQIDVLCWLNAAKIYTSDGIKIFKTITKDNLTFVPICVVHHLKELSSEELIALHSSIIEINVFTDKNKIGSQAKSNKTEVVYLKEFHSDDFGFLEAYSERFSMSQVSTKKSVKTYRSEDLDEILAHSTVYQKNEAYSAMYFEENFDENLYEIIDFATNEDVPNSLINFKDFEKPYNPEEETLKETAKNKVLTKDPSDKHAKKDAKKGKAEKAPTKLTLLMQGEVLFTDPGGAVFHQESSKFDVSHLFVVVQVQNMLTRRQKIHLNPIVLKLRHISNFPFDVFENSGFTDIYCKYSIPCIAECKTMAKPISDFIYFNNSHIYFTHTLSKIKLLEFLETKRLLIEIHGVKQHTLSESDPKLFGEKSSDRDISKIHKKFKKLCLKNEESIHGQEEILAYCSYDLSSLLKNVWDFRERAQLHNIENSVFLRRHFDESQQASSDPTCDFWSAHHMSTNSINLAQIENSIENASTSPLREWMLLSNNTSLSLEAYLLSPQAPALVLHQIPNTYKRLFFVAYNPQVALECFSMVFKHNEEILCHKLKTEDMLTGWGIDNGNNVAIYVEGLAIGYILNIWQELANNFPISELKIFFNTDQAYENRLYQLCSKWSGFYIIAMRVPLQLILKDWRLYVKGNTPLLCLKALTKLHLLFNTRTLKQMLQHDLFPTIEEIVSLDIEYGLPYAWKELEESVDISMSIDKDLQSEIVSFKN